MICDNVIKAKSYSFAVAVVKTYKYLSTTNHEFVLSKQLLRCGTSIGALVSESEFAQSRADFIHKLSIALKEANETKYWISLLRDTDMLDSAFADKLYSDVKEIVAILVSIIKTSKDNS